MLLSSMELLPCCLIDTSSHCRLRSMPPDTTPVSLSWSVALPLGKQVLALRRLDLRFGGPCREFTQDPSLREPMGRARVIFHTRARRRQAASGALEWPLTCGLVLTDDYRWCPN